MNQRFMVVMIVLYERYDCMKALAMIPTKMIVSVVQSVGIFFSLKRLKNWLLALCPDRHMAFLF